MAEQDKSENKAVTENTASKPKKRVIPVKKAKGKNEAETPVSVEQDILKMEAEGGLPATQPDTEIAEQPVAHPPDAAPHEPTLKEQVLEMQSEGGLPADQSAVTAPTPTAAPDVQELQNQQAILNAATAAHGQWVQLEIEGEIATAWIDQPGKKVNLLSNEMLTSIQHVIHEVNAHPEIKALIFASRKADNFVAGAD